MKIGITCYPTVGGSGIVATELGKSLAERGHEIHFITSDMPFRLGKFHKNIYYHQVEVSDYDVFRYPPYDISLASKMAEVARAEELDVLHVHYAIPHAISAFLAKQMVGDHLKIVTTLHGTDITVMGYDHSLSEIVRFGIEKSDAVTAVSQHLVDETKQLLHIQKPIDKVYNCIDEREYYPREVNDYRNELAPNGEKILMHVSNFRPVKRVQDVVHIFKHAHEKMPVKLLLVGEGPDTTLARELASELGVSDDVRFLGRQEDMACFYSLADLLLLTSEQESFGLVALEAMACGVPVIGTAAGGIPEVVTSGSSGLLRPIGDVAGMSADVVRLLSNPTLYEQFAANALKEASDSFSQQNITSQYEAIYERVHAGSREVKST